MVREAIEHRMDSAYSHALDESTAVIRLRAKKGDLTDVVLFYGDRAHQTDPVAMTAVRMESAGCGELFEYFEAEVKTPYTRICYYFVLSDRAETVYYYGDGFHDTVEVHRSQYYQLPFLHRSHVVEIPEWFRNAVIYQVFPDSFASGRRTLACRPVSKTHGPAGSVTRLGGTIPGITENLDHIAELGADCLYLNPIFAANSYHKYDTIDYFAVDPCFGDEDSFRALVREAHRRGIRIVLDGVFNHSGPDFFAFRDLLEHGVHSRFRNWYYNVSFPVRYADPPNYDCFGYVRSMPKLNTADPEVIEYFCTVGAHWLREFDVDGWRLDVANEIDHDFWRAFRKAVRSVKADAVLIAEIWEDAHTWLEGDQFDSTMNYRFTDAVRRFFAEDGIPGSRFAEKLTDLVMRYRRPVSYAQMTFLDTHDVPRFLHWCGGDLRRQRLAALVQFTVPGVPSVFAGDERAMNGLTEAEYRAPFRWVDTPEAAETTRWYRTLIALRKSSPELVSGEFRALAVGPEPDRFADDRERNDGGPYIRAVSVETGRPAAERVAAFERRLGDLSTVVLVNAGEEPCLVTLPYAGKAALEERLTGALLYGTGRCVTVELQPYGAAVLRAQGVRIVRTSRWLSSD